MIFSVLCLIYLWSICLKGLLRNTKDILCKMLSIELSTGVILYLLGHLAVSGDSFRCHNVVEEMKCD